MSGQMPSAIFMMRPSNPGSNQETVESNEFMNLAIEHDAADIKSAIVKEFDHMVDVLESHDIAVKVFSDSAEPIKPDAHFPNNWISTHSDGSVVLYPMMAENRRRERREDVVEWLKMHYKVSAVLDMSSGEESGKYLEGTGSMVFDYPNRIVYACRSSRTSEELFYELGARLNHQPVLFDAVDEKRVPVYHTNVLMCVGSRFAILCLDAIKDISQQEILLDSLANTGHQVVAISYDQMRSFAGNMIEVRTRGGDPVVVLSDRAFNSLLPGQVDAISKHADMLPISIPMIEDVGGGSVRCMIAGIFLPK